MQTVDTLQRTLTLVQETGYKGYKAALTFELILQRLWSEASAVSGLVFVPCVTEL